MRISIRIVGLVLSIVSGLVWAFPSVFASEKDSGEFWAEPTLSAGKPSVLAAPQDKEGLERLLRGKWQQAYWRTNKNNAYEPQSEFVRVYKIYFGGKFYFYEHYPNGEIVRSYGGSYQIVDEHTITEIIEFYAPYRRREAYIGADEQMVLFSGLSMVGAISRLNVRVEGHHMYQVGLLSQYTKHVDNPESFGDRAMDHGFVKIHN